MAPNIEFVLEQPHLLGLDAPTGKIDPIDATTPDAHVSRDPRLIRLTGKHPLNAEPPVKSLIESGFITSNSLHVVRNHGPVPLNDSNTHVISIGGLVNHPVMITMSQLLELPSVTLPVTICCAGNRRKEQNMIKPSIGFSWGPAGVGTAYWTGVYLRDVINTFAGGLKPEALHICMEGNDSTAKGPYGTSLTVQRAMSPEYDVMLAYKMNGEPLPYDHGYPVRSIVPGCIGGRSVKWLSKIEATTYISRNPFQDADNKVFPPTVLSADQATTENWWSNPDYSVYDLNINSVIAAPFHGTQVLLDDLNKLITLKGYAYGGSNRKVTRCEITIDDGKTWKLATIHTELKKKADAYAAVHFDKSMQRPNKSYSETRNWTWVHWSLELPITDLLGAKEICLRCWNDANNSQPKDMTWSLMGMLNNCWYRVRVHLVREPALALLFQHPTTLPGDKTLEGISLSGWMEEENASKLSTEKKKSQGSDDNLKLFSEEEVAKHDTEDDCWLIYNEKVYDCTSFLTKHPGGASSIILAAGTDCTDEFDAIHSQKAKDMFEDYLIGKIKTKATIETKAQPQEEPIEEVVSKEEAHTAAYFEPKTWKKLVLQNKECLSPTLFRFTFSIPEEHYDNSHLSLPVGMHVFLKLKEDINDCSPKPKMVIRAYTPSKVSKKTIEFVIKVYFPYNNVPGGRLTTALNCIRVGESIDFKGPVGEIEYHGNGELSIHQKRRNVKQIGMIAGGTGITPMWQIIQALEHDQERPLVSLIYCARSINEIIFHKELDILQSRYGSDKFKVRYILSNPPKQESVWTGGSGRFCMTELQEYLFPFEETDNRVVFLCGPEPMQELCCKPLLKEAFGEKFCLDNVFTF